MEKDIQNCKKYGDRNVEHWNCIFLICYTLLLFVVVVLTTYVDLTQLHLRFDLTYILQAHAKRPLGHLRHKTQKSCPCLKLLTVDTHTNIHVCLMERCIVKVKAASPPMLTVSKQMLDTFLKKRMFGSCKRRLYNANDKCFNDLYSVQSIQSIKSTNTYGIALLPTEILVNVIANLVRPDPFVDPVCTLHSLLKLSQVCKLMHKLVTQLYGGCIVMEAVAAVVYPPPFVENSSLCQESCLRAGFNTLTSICNLSMCEESISVLLYAQDLPAFKRNFDISLAHDACMTHSIRMPNMRHFPKFKLSMPLENYVVEASTNTSGNRIAVAFRRDNLRKRAREDNAEAEEGEAASSQFSGWLQNKQEIVSVIQAVECPQQNNKTIFQTQWTTSLSACKDKTWTTKHLLMSTSGKRLLAIVDTSREDAFEAYTLCPTLCKVLVWNISCLDKTPTEIVLAVKNYMYPMHAWFVNTDDGQEKLIGVAYSTEYANYPGRRVASKMTASRPNNNGLLSVSAWHIALFTLNGDLLCAYGSGASMLLDISVSENGQTFCTVSASVAHETLEGQTFYKSEVEVWNVPFSSMYRPAQTTRKMLRRVSVKQLSKVPVACAAISHDGQRIVVPTKSSGQGQYGLKVAMFVRHTSCQWKFVGMSLCSMQSPCTPVKVKFMSCGRNATINGLIHGRAKMYVFDFTQASEALFSKSANNMRIVSFKESNTVPCSVRMIDAREKSWVLVYGELRCVYAPHKSVHNVPGANALVRNIVSMADTW